MINKDRLIIFFERLSGVSFYLLAAAVTFSNAFVEIASAAVIFSWAATKALNKTRLIKYDYVVFALSVFIFLNLASFLNTGYLSESMRGFLKIVKHAFIFLAAADYFNTRKRLRDFILFSAYFSFIIFLNGIAQYITGTDLIRQRAMDPLDSLRRVSSSFVHSNDFGAYIVVIISIAAAVVLSGVVRFKEKALLSIVLVVAAWSIVNTSSRGAWIGLAAALFMVALALGKKRFFIGIILCVVAILAISAPARERLYDLMPSNKQGGTVWERTKLWEGTIDMIKAHPIIGFGVNTYTRNFPAYKPKDYPDIRYTHNSYLQMAAETGIAGAVSFIIFACLVIGLGLKAVLGLQGHEDKALLLGLICGITGFLVHCAVDTHLYSTTLSSFLYLYIGVIYAVFRSGHEINKA